MVDPGKKQSAGESLVELALADYLRRGDRGEQVDREAFLADYPEVAEDLRSYFATADALERMAGPTAQEQSPPSAETSRNRN